MPPELKKPNERIRFGNYNLSPEHILAIAECIAKYDDFVWDDFTDKEKWSFVESFIVPIPVALEQVGLTVTRKNEIEELKQEIQSLKNNNYSNRQNDRGWKLAE